MTAAALTDFRSAAAQPTLAVAAGRVLILAGAAFGLANLFQYGVQSGALHLHEATLALSWPIALTVFFTGLARIRRAGGEATQRVARWSRGVIGLTLGSAVALAGVAAVSGDWGLMRWTSVVSLGLYGAGWMISALRTGVANMALLAGISIVGAAGVALALRVGAPEHNLLQAVTLALVALLPGLWLAAGRRL